MERLGQDLVPCLSHQNVQVSLMETSTVYPSPVSTTSTLGQSRLTQPPLFALPYPTPLCLMEV